MRAKASGAPGEPVCRRLFTFEQAAEFGGVPVQRICHWMMVGKLRVYHLVGGPRIDEVELADFLSSPKARN